MTSDSANAAPADRKFFGSCLIIEAESLETVRELIESDIYYTTNVVRTLPSDALIYFDSWRDKWDKEKLQILPIALAHPLPPVSLA